MASPPHSRKRLTLLHRKKKRAGESLLSLATSDAATWGNLAHASSSRELEKDSRSCPWSCLGVTADYGCSLYGRTLIVFVKLTCIPGAVIIARICLPWSATTPTKIGPGAPVSVAVKVQSG